MNRKDRLNELLDSLWEYRYRCNRKINGKKASNPRQDPCFGKDEILNYLFNSCGAGVKGKDKNDDHYSLMMEIVDEEKFEEMFFKAWKTRDINNLKRCAKYLLNRGIVAYWEPCEDGRRMDKLPWWAWMPQTVISIITIIILLCTLR